MLKFDQVTKTYGANTAVHAASFVVDKPMMIGIIERSGELPPYIRTLT